MKTPVAEKLILNIQRVIRAPRPRVFAAFASLEEIKKWLGGGNHVTAGKMDFRKGGQYLFTSVCADTGPADLVGTYQEIVPNELIRFTWKKTGAATEHWGEMLVTVRFADHKDGTLLSLTHEGFINEEVRQGHNKGWCASFDQLGKNLE